MSRRSEILTCFNFALDCGYFRKDKHVPQKILVLAVILLLQLTGCIGFNNAPPQVDFYTFEYEPPDATPAVTTAYILKIDGFHVSSVYDDDRLLMRSQAFKRNEYSRHRWRANPGDLVADYLARDLARSAFFRAVVRTEPIPDHSHLLTGMIEEFYQHKDGDQWKAILSLNVMLVDETSAPGDGNVLFQQRYAFQEPVPDQTPGEFVAGMSVAMRKLSTMLMVDISEALGR